VLVKTPISLFMHRTDGRLYISSPECIFFLSRSRHLSFSFSFAFSLFLSFTLSLSFTPLHLRSFENCARPVGEVTVRLWLSREFSGFLRAFPQSVAPRDSFSRTRCCTPCVSLPRRYPQALLERLVCLSLSLSCSLVFVLTNGVGI